jgi:hypothetical protein
MKTSSSVKPIVAPETKENVFLIPWFAPDDTITKFTGPGDIDIANENENIAINRDIYFPILCLCIFGLTHNAQIRCAVGVTWIFLLGAILSIFALTAKPSVVYQNCT